MTSKVKNILIFSIIGFLIAATITCVCCVLLVKPKDQPLAIDCNSSITLEAGKSYTLNISCSDPEATIEFKSSNTKIATVSAEGVVFGVKKGIAIIRVSASNEKSVASKNISVSVTDPETPALPEDPSTDTTLNFEVNLEENISLFLLDKELEKAYADNVFNYVDFSCETEYGYSIQDSKIISFEDDRITALAEGSTTITFFPVADPSIVSSHSITVNTVPPTLKLTSGENLSIKQGNQSNVTYSIQPAYYTGSVKIDAVVSDSSIISYSDGNITALNAGSATLTLLLNNSPAKIISVTVTTDTSLPPSEDNPTDTPPNEGEPTPPEVTPENPEDNSSEVEQEEEYKINITTLSGCTLSGSTITVTSSNAQFKVSLKDKNGSTVNDTAVITDNVNLYKGLGGTYIIKATSDFSFTITYSSVGLTKEFNVVFQN